MSVRSNSVSRRGSECYETGAGLVPDMNLAYDMEPPDPHRDLLCMRVSNVMNIGTSYHEYVVHVESGFLSVYENVGDRLRHEAGTLKDRVYLRDAVVERVTDVQHGVKVNTLVLAIKPMDSTHSAHWRKFKFRSSEDPKRTDGSITLEWEIIIRKHILFYHENGIIITPDPGLVFELSREENCVDSAAMKMKTIFVNVCSDDLMPKIIKRGVIKEKRMRIIRGPERVLRGRTGVYNVIDVVIEPEALELCLEDVDVKEKVAWMIVRELRLRDRSIVKIAQGSSVRFREKTRYAGLNRDGQACGMLVNNENVKIFLLGNQDISVSAQELPLEEVEEVEQQLAPLEASFARSPAAHPASSHRCCTPFFVVKGAGCDVYSSPDVESRKIVHLRKGDFVYVVGRTATAGSADEDMKNCWVRLLDGGWVQLLTTAGVRCLHPIYDIAHKIQPDEVGIFSTNLMIKMGSSVWTSIFRPRKKKELDVRFTIRIAYRLPDNVATDQLCEVHVMRSLVEFIELEGKVKKHVEKAAERSGTISACESSGYVMPALPAVAEMNEDLLVSQDGAQIMADSVQMVQIWLRQALKIAPGILVNFLTPNSSDWRYIESSLSTECALTTN